MYNLDPSHYITLPSLSWDAMLKFTDVNFELISDPTIHQHIEKSFRGGISMVVKRYARANKKYLPDTYDPTKPIVYILYFDKNNLYGYAMFQPLPVGGFRFATKEEIQNIDTKDFLPGFYNVDLEYPEELHDLHNDFPCAPKHMGEGNGKRLISGLNDKYDYYVHYRLLKVYLRLGLRLKKINFIIFFKEEAFMKPYIEKNTKLRQESISKIKKDIYKLKNNSVYGKTMENVRKYKNIKVLNVDDSASVLQDIATEYEGYSPSLSHHLKTSCTMNKPIAIESAVLDISKVLMYEFWYDYVKQKWGDKVKLLLFKIMGHFAPARL